MLSRIWDELRFVRRVVILADGQPMPKTDLPVLPVAGEYEALLERASPDFPFGEFDENTKAAVFYTTGTTGDPKGVSYSHRNIVLHAMSTAMNLCAPREGQRLHREDVVREHLMKHVAMNRISRYAVPEEARIVFVDEIPKTSFGKIDKKRLRSMAQ